MPAAPQLALSLDDALRTALANNLTYKAAAQDVIAAQGQLIEARGGALPSLSAGYSYVHSQNAAFFFIPVPQPTGPPRLQKALFSATDMNNVNATLQYALYTGGAVQAAIGQAAAGFSAAQSAYAATRANVIGDATNAYFDLVLARRTAVIQDEAVAVAQQNFTTSQQLYQAGTAAKADVLRQQVTLANAQAEAVRAHNTADLANAQLANLLDLNLNTLIVPSVRLEMQVGSYSLPDLIAQAQTRRPEVAAAADAVTIAELAVKGARAGTLPTVALQVSDASSKPNFVNVPQPQLTETLAVVWKLFDGGLTHGKVVQASAQVDKAKINLRQLRNGVDLEVRRAYFNYAAALAAATAAESAQSAAAEGLRVNQLRYRSGVGTSLELSDALLAYTQTQVQYARALATERTALVELQRAAGLL
jgi:outer membrane protein